MLQINRIDVKTGLALQETIEGIQQTKTKQVEHSYLEHWLSAHGLDAQLHIGRFYDDVNEADRQRLEAEGKVLIFTSGKDGYFTDPDTAKLMNQGDADRDISPIYAGDRNSPHNFVAYGSLIASDGMASAALQQARILVIDDEGRSHGDVPLLDKSGQPLPQEELQQLYNKMGDGTMLVPQAVMRALITPQEQESARDEHQLDFLASRIASQFRAATTELPGIIKGTMASSGWCDRLGVDAIISSNDIKGDDGRLSSPGIKELSDFWVNRKSDGQYGEQAVGPQVKGCIPEATLREFNPRIKEQAEALAAVASDPIQLRHYYVQQKEKQRGRIEASEDGDRENALYEKRSEWLYEVLKADKFDQLSQFAKVNDELERYLKGEWLDNALRGIYVPSAMAQNHGELRPWEVCNKDLPHGAIVAYYRSPFPNVGAAAIAINNTETIQQSDPEAFSKDGVAYLPPWTAKNIAITDFDRDANGYFVGYRPTVPDLPQQVRQQLESLKGQPQAEQYEAGRSLFAQMVQQLEQGQEGRIITADYPIAVKEFIDCNTPEQKPPEITKQAKVKHPWQVEESHSAAVWRAWRVTADDPIGKVANAGMILQSLALEMTYAPAEQKEALLRQVSAHFLKQLQQAAQGKLLIPDDEWLQHRGFPAYYLKERMEQVAAASSQLVAIQESKQRHQFIEEKLQTASRLLSDVVNGPNAENLQTAVDSAKSSRGIDTAIHSFARALSYKDHILRQHYRDYDNYQNGKTLPTNTQEPIGWGVEAVNRLYQNVQLPELRHEAVRDLFPKSCTPHQEEKALLIARTYSNFIREKYQVEDRLRQNRPEDQKPTLLITSSSGRALVIQNLQDKQGTLPIWRASGPQPDWDITIQKDAQARSEATRFPARLSYTTDTGERRSQLLGYVAQESSTQHQLGQRLQQRGNELPIHSPHAQIQAPFAQQNDADEMLSRAMRYVQESVSQIPKDEHLAYASALWRQSFGMKFALKQFTDVVSDRLGTVPEIVLTGIQHSSNQVGHIPPGNYTARFSEYSYSKNGETRTASSVAIVSEDGTERQFGALSARSMHLPLGTTVTAHIAIEPSGKTARMQILDLATAPEPQAASNLIDTSALFKLPVVAEGATPYPTAQPDSYSPSRQELRQWYMIAALNQDEVLKTRITQKGQQLKELYGSEVGPPGAAPPLEYSHHAVTITESERQQMKQGIDATKATMQAVEVLQSQDPIQRRPQLEMG